MNSILLAQASDVPVRGMSLGWFTILLVLGVGFWLGSRQRRHAEVPRGVSLARTIIGGVFAILVSIALIAAITVGTVMTYRVEQSRGVQSVTIAERVETQVQRDLNDPLERPRSNAERQSLEQQGLLPARSVDPAQGVVASESPVSALDAAPIHPLPAQPAPPPASTAAVASLAGAATVLGTTTAGRPPWLEDGVQKNGEVTSIVVTSQQFATQDEAAQQADRQVQQLLRDDFAQIVEHAAFRPRELSIDSSICSSAIRDRFVEVSERDFGTFTAPMYRVWYRVELSPSLRNQMLARWKVDEQQMRLKIAVVGFGALLLVPLTVLGYGRVIRWTVNRGGKGALVSGVLAAMGSLWMIFLCKNR